VTVEQLLEAVRSARTKLPATEGPQGITTAEIAAAHRLTVDGTLATIVKPLVKAGKLKAVKVQRYRIDGQRQMVPGWVPVGKQG